MNEQQEQSENSGYEGFAIVEVFGHRSHGGYVRPWRIAGQEMIRVDVPNVHEEGKTLSTHYYGGSAIFCLTPATEETVREYESRKQYRPPTALQLPGSYREEEQPDTEPPPELENDPEADDNEEFCGGVR